MIKRLTNIVLFTSIPISIGATSLVLRTSNLYDFETNWNIVFFSFFSTLFTYNLSKIVPLWNVWKPEKKEFYAYNERNNWNIKHKNKLLLLTLFSFLTLLFFLFKLNQYQIIFLGHLGVISILYSVPIFSGKAMRTIPLIKIFLIAYVWSGISIIPLIQGELIINQKLTFIFLESFCFIMAITIPFDIRDYTRDKNQGVKTIPSLLGIENARFFAILLLVLSTIFSHFVFNNSTQEIANFCMNIIFIPILLNSKEEHGEIYYLGLIDSTLFLRLFIFYI